jgi:signal transduction histidine kinase
MKFAHIRSASSHERVALFVVLAIVLAAIEIFADVITWVELDVATIYGLPLVLIAFARKRRMLWLLTGLLLVATFAVYAMQIAPGVFARNEKFFVNRLLDAIAILLTAGLLQVWITLLAKVDAQRELLKDQNSKLESANVALIRNQEHTVAQNEKLEAANLALMRSQEQIAAQNEELEQRRAEAEQTSLRKSQLFASFSHDIRTPVNTINLMSEIICRAAQDPTLAKGIPSMTRRLQSTALSLMGLLSEVLDIARLDSDHTKLNITTFSLNELITSKCRDLLLLADARALRLELRLSEPDVRLQTDRIMLDRVLTNLITNAIKFTDRGSVIIGARTTADGAALIDVRDTGPGIASNQLSLIFEEFGQVHGATAGSNKGWGLGLAICRRLVAAMGGTIIVESEIGVGTRFIVRLPATCVGAQQ